MSNNTLAFIKQLNLSTGKTKLLVTSSDAKLVAGLTIYGYFKVLADLNKSANIYGCVYIPSDDALAALHRLESNSN